MIIERWVIDQKLKNEIDTHYKTTYARTLKDKDALEIAKELTFDRLAPSITTEELVRFLAILNKDFAHRGIHGVGLEVGSGPGTFVAAFAKFSNIQKMYGIEVCQPIVEELMTKVVAQIAGDSARKVVGVVGDFDHIELPDNSVDFIFDFFSLHHSSNLQRTLTELARVLKRGGVIVCVDKARANILSEEDLEKLLDQEYPAEAKIGMGLPPDAMHTRRMNGEREYRLRDWNDYFVGAGFTEATHYKCRKNWWQFSYTYDEASSFHSTDTCAEQAFKICYT